MGAGVWVHGELEVIMERRMGVEEMRPGMRLWCWWMHRYIWYMGKSRISMRHEFMDIADVLVQLTDKEISGLRRVK